MKFWNIDDFNQILKNRANEIIIETLNNKTCTYTYNELGFRGDSISKDGFKILSIGCSNTEGVGVNDEQTWPYYFSKYIKNGVNLNFGRSGFSNDYISRCLITYFDLVKPDLVLIMYTEPFRLEYFTKEHKIAPFHPIGWGYFLDTEEGKYKHKALVELSNNENDLQNWYKNHLLIKNFLKVKNCNFLWNGWHLSTDEEDEYRFDGDFSPYYDFGIDNIHPGPINNFQYAKRLYNHIINNYPNFIPKI